MSSHEPGAPARTAGNHSLRALARASIAHGLREGRPLPVDLAGYTAELRAPGASFVTLRKSGELRGCTGTLEPSHPLVVDVAENAFRSAFGDRRFPPLAAGELEELSISVSVLSPLEPIRARSQEELLARLRPGIDGVVLRDGPHVGTFLPSVWESLPDPKDFLDALFRKSLLPPDHWSGTLRFERYTTREAA
jgi:AmmeMemoRadiSam system protein A